MAMNDYLPEVVIKAYEILRWLIEHVGKFPRSHRFVLGDRTESRMLTVLEELVRASYARENGVQALTVQPLGDREFKGA
ncbi:hypothetical protein YTPLAS18_10080 [Nitrospira sp.]|nr:hypothetical protein YTPLAS18_10080 [Nitrospira sp.]